MAAYGVEVMTSSVPFISLRNSPFARDFLFIDDQPVQSLSFE